MSASGRKIVKDDTYLIKGTVNGNEIVYRKIQYVWTDEYNGRRRKAKLVNEFSVLIKVQENGSKDSGLHILVNIPAGYKTDFASIPFIAQVFLGDRIQFAEESIAHDWLCDRNAPRFLANATMRIIMESMGRPKWKVLAVYYALMIAGYGSPIFRLFTKLFSKKVKK